MSLPKPYYDDSAGIVIYNGDCRAILPELPKVDLVLTDPPYGIGIAANPVRQKHERMEWDAAPPEAALFASLIERSTYQIIWGGNYFALPAAQCFLIWDKAQPENFSLAMCEQAWTNIRKPAKMFRMSVTSYAKEHPTQKPVQLMAWCMTQPTEECATILDPFMGSGTTLVAAKRLGRRAIGIEIEERYCEIAARRIEAERATLFEAPPEQLGLMGGLDGAA